MLLFVEYFVYFFFGFLRMSNIECLYFAISFVVSFREECNITVVEERKESISIFGVDGFDFFAFYGHIRSSSDT